MSPRPKKHHRAHNLSILLLAAVALLIVAFFAFNQSNIRSQASEVAFDYSHYNEIWNGPSCSNSSATGDRCILYGSVAGSCQQNYTPSCGSPSGSEPGAGIPWQTAHAKCSVSITNQSQCDISSGCEWNSAGNHCQLPSCGQFASQGKAVCDGKRVNIGTSSSPSLTPLCFFKKSYTSGYHCEYNKDAQPKNCGDAQSFGVNFCNNFYSQSEGSCYADIIYPTPNCGPNAAGDPDCYMNIMRDIKFSCVSRCSSYKTSDTCTGLCVWSDTSGPAAGSPSTGQCSYRVCSKITDQDKCRKSECQWNPIDPGPSAGGPTGSCSDFRQYQSSHGSMMVDPTWAATSASTSSFGAAGAATPTSSVSAPPPPVCSGTGC